MNISAESLDESYDKLKKLYPQPLRPVNSSDIKCSKKRGSYELALRPEVYAAIVNTQLHHSSIVAVMANVIAVQLQLNSPHHQFTFMQNKANREEYDMEKLIGHLTGAHPIMVDLSSFDGTNLIQCIRNTEALNQKSNTITGIPDFLRLHAAIIGNSKKTTLEKILIKLISHTNKVAKQLTILGAFQQEYLEVLARWTIRKLSKERMIFLNVIRGDSFVISDKLKVDNQNPLEPTTVKLFPSLKYPRKKDSGIGIMLWMDPNNPKINYSNFSDEENTQAFHDAISEIILKHLSQSQ